jgi:glyoxylase-like metal-dependent hydrolase (beta-lactamase superfamily II)
MKSLYLLSATLIVSFCSLRSFGQISQPKLTITHLTGDFYVYTTYNLYGKEYVPSNSMYLVTNKGVVMFDTPWDTTQCQPLLDSIQQRHHQQVVLSISTHFHEDRTGGLAFLQSKGVKTWSSFQTLELCKQRGEKQAAFYFTKDTTFNIGNHHFQTYYPGAGHAPDNILIWFGKEKVLYGGCFIKSTEATSLGNLSDANLQEWPLSIHKVINKFPVPKYVIPGHEGWSNNRSLQHTLQLLKTHNNKTS